MMSWWPALGSELNPRRPRCEEGSTHIMRFICDGVSGWVTLCFTLNLFLRAYVKLVCVWCRKLGFYGVNTSEYLSPCHVTGPRVVNNHYGRLKLTLEQAIKAQAGSRGIALSLTSTLGGGGRSTPRPGRFTSEKETRYPFYRRLGGPQGRSGRVLRISPPPGFDPRGFTFG